MSSGAPNDYAELAWICRSWWRWLNAFDGDGKHIKIGDAEKPRDRAALARLRRIDVVDLGGTAVVDVAEALGIAAFRNLVGRVRIAAEEKKLSGRILRWLAEDTLELSPFAIAAATLARVRSDDGGEVARCGETALLLGAPRAEGADREDRLFAEARFKRLIRTRNDWPDLMRQARRVAAILEQSAPIGDLGASLILWNADPRVSRNWAFQYYGRDYEPADPPDARAVAVTA